MKRFLIVLFLTSQIFLNACTQEKAGDTNAPKAPRGYINETFLKAAYALGFLDLIETKPAIPENIKEFKDITYKQIDSIDLKLDIYRQKSLTKAVPVLIFIHGGGWSKGKRSDYLPYLIDFAQKGYVTVTVSYRLSGVAHFPAALEDVKCAVRWIRKNAFTYGIDPDRIAVIGGSAGGHLALMLAYTNDLEFSDECPDSVGSRVNAVVDIYGPVDLATPYAQKRPESTSFLGRSYNEDPAIFKEASPRFYICPDNPPTLIFHGTIDSLVPVSQSDSLHLWLDKTGVPNEYHRLKGWPHTMDISKKVNNYCQYYMNAFFEKYL